MHLISCQPLSIVILIGSHWLEIGSFQAKVATIGLFIVTVLFAALAPNVTFLARLPKWILALISTGLLIAQAIFTFGSPLAGVIYWSSFSLAAAVLLPLVAILLVVGLFRRESLRFVLPQIAVCILLGILCFTTT
jgi:membrane protein YdbS with pleckstrin-like domain